MKIGGVEQRNYGWQWRKKGNENMKNAAIMAAAMSAVMKSVK